MKQIQKQRPQNKRAKRTRKTESPFTKLAMQTKGWFRQVLLSYLDMPEIVKVSLLSKQFHLVVEVNQNLERQDQKNIYLEAILTEQYGQLFLDFKVKAHLRVRLLKDMKPWFCARKKRLSMSLMQNDSVFINFLRNSESVIDRSVREKVQEIQKYAKTL